jgi:AcrR family transcriptional regulator
MEKQKEERISKIRDIKSELILNAALAVFSRKGIYGTNLEEIAVEAGFSKASLYNYYPNKETIICNLYIREAEVFIDELQNSAEYSINCEYSFEENLRRYLLLAFNKFERHFNFALSVNLFELFEIKEKSRYAFPQDLICLRKQYYEQGLMKILSWGIEKHEIVSLFPNTLFCGIIDAMVTTVMVNWVHEKNMGDIEKATQDLVYLIMNGIKE